MEYFVVEIFFLVLTFFLRFKFKIRVYDTKKEALIITLVFLILGVIVDSFAVWRGYWSFPEHRLIGITIGFLPIEEYFLFLIAPFFGIVSYKVMHQKLRVWA